MLSLCGVSCGSWLYGVSCGSYLKMLSFSIPTLLKYIHMKILQTSLSSFVKEGGGGGGDIFE